MQHPGQLTLNKRGYLHNLCTGLIKKLNNESPRTVGLSFIMFFVKMSHKLKASHLRSRIQQTLVCLFLETLASPRPMVDSNNNLCRLLGALATTVSQRLCNAYQWQKNVAQAQLPSLPSRGLALVEFCLHWSQHVVFVDLINGIQIWEQRFRLHSRNDA